MGFPAVKHDRGGGERFFSLSLSLPFFLLSSFFTFFSKPQFVASTVHPRRRPPLSCYPPLPPTREPASNEGDT